MLTLHTACFESIDFDDVVTFRSGMTKKWTRSCRGFRLGGRSMRSGVRYAVSSSQGMFGAQMKIIARAFYRRFDIRWERDTIWGTTRTLRFLFISSCRSSCAAAFYVLLTELVSGDSSTTASCERVVFMRPVRVQGSSEFFVRGPAEFPNAKALPPLLLLPTFLPRDSESMHRTNFGTDRNGKHTNDNVEKS